MLLCNRGGAAALRSYIIEAAGPIKLRFVDESELLNVNGYLKLAKIKSITISIHKHTRCLRINEQNRPLRIFGGGRFCIYL